MPIVQIQSATAAQTQGSSGVGAKAGAGHSAAIGFEALFALEIGNQDSLDSAQAPQQSAQLTPVTDEDAAATGGGDAPDAADAGIAASAETLLPPGLVLPAVAPAANAVPASEHANVSSLPQHTGAPSRRQPPTERIEIADETANDAHARKFPAGTAQATLLPATLQAAGKVVAEAVSAERPIELSAPGIDKNNAQPLLQTQSPQTAARLPAATAPAALELRMSMDAPEWGEALAQRVILLAGRTEQRAEIRVNPQHLGPIEVSLSFGGDDSRQAAVHFSAAQAPVREAIESALPRLREMFEQAGIQLGDATVGAGTSERDQGHASPRPRGAGGSAPSAGTLASVTSQRVSEGMVDTFA